MAQTSIMENWVGQEDPHTGLGFSALGSKEKTQAHLVPCRARQMGTIKVSIVMVWCGMGERERDWFRSCG